MKQFFKNVAATIVGIFGFGIIMVILAVITLIGMMCNSSKTPSLKDNSVMVMKLQGQISDQASDDWLGQLTGNQYNNLGMNNILSAIKKAKQEDKVKGIYLETGILSTDYATLQEIRNALADFKKSGKWIIAYGDAMTQGGYYLASVANKVYVNPEGSVDWHGIASQTQYIKDVAAKFGVHFTIVKVGKYKSFTEMYTEDKMSDANREQVTRYIGGLWNQILADVSKSRNITKDSLNRYADGLMVFDDTKLLKSRKLPGRNRKSSNTRCIRKRAADCEQRCDSGSSGSGQRQEHQGSGTPHQLRWWRCLCLRTDLACSQSAQQEETCGSIHGWHGSFGCILYEYGCQLYHGSANNSDG